MASLALGVAGAYVGSFFGPLGASLGWGIGAAVGGLFGGKTQHGPRLTDLRAQASAYGQPIPIGFGTIRIAGNVIWADDLAEHRKKSGGKGGPKTVSYSYTQSFAVGLCETSFLQDGTLVNNPIVGILRIWADGRLIYGEGSDGTSLPMTIYYGTEDQDADPTIEAKEGAGNVPAHRGMAYVVFTDLEVASFGNRIPNLTFEVIASGAIELQYKYRWPVDYDYPIDASAYSYPYNLNGVDSSVAGQLTLHRYRSGDDYPPAADNELFYESKTFDLAGTEISSVAETSQTFGTDPLVTNVRVYGSMNSGIAYATWNEDLLTDSGVQTFLSFAWLKDGVVTFTPQDLVEQGTLNRSQSVVGGLIYWNGYLYAITGATYPIVRRWNASDSSVYVEQPEVSFDLEPYTHDSANSDPVDLIIGDDGYLYCRVSYFGGGSPDVGVLGGWGVKLVKLDADLNLIKDWYDPSLMTGGVTTALGVPGYSSGVVYRGHWISYQSAGVLDVGHPNFIMYRMESDESFTFIDELQITDPPQDVGALIYIGSGLAAFRGGILQLGSTGTTWGDIVANVSQHMGFADAEYDVSELTDPVRGYAIGSRMTGRAAIEAGMPAFSHGAVESNLVVKFPKWGGTVDATVTSDDLGARDDSSDPVDPLEITRLDDKQLPQRIEVVYLNYSMDYQEGTQYAARTASYSDLTVAVSIPLVFVDSEAKKIADVLEYNAWLERDKFKFSLPRKWAHLEPTDVLALDGHAVRIVDKDEQGYTHIQFTGVGTGTGVFVTAPVAPVPIGFVPQTPPTLNRTDLLLLDIPMVTDADFQVGYSAVMAGRTSSAWPGAGLFKSIDGGVNYDSIASTVEPDTFGVATTVLADWGGGNVFDETNTVTVRLTPGSGELTSSNELGVLNGANKAMLGSEMIQFKTATLDDLSSGGSRTYTLSGLLRYRRGTDRGADHPAHALNENFVIVPAHNLEADFHELGQSRSYKAVTSGGLLASATALAFTNGGVSLKPYAPVELGGGRNGAGDITINWTPRVRIGGAWLDYTDVSLDSDGTEIYKVNFYSASYAAVLFSAIVTTNTKTLVAADQTTNYGGLVNPLYVGVQRKGYYGYGYEARSAV